VEGYRFGFQNQEKDDEIKGEGNSYTTEFRQLDPRLGRWLSVDPLEAQRAWVSPFNFVQNNSLMRIDPDGKLDDWYLNEDGKMTYNSEVHEQKDLDDRGIIGRYVGKSAIGMVDLEDNRIKYNEDGTKSIIATVPIIVKNRPASFDSAPWINVGLKEIGVKEYNKNYHPNDQYNNPRIVEYLNSAGNKSQNDETAWCASFVHWSFSQVGINGAGAVGFNYKSWGYRIDKPIYGAVAIFKTGHVGFYLGTNNDGTIKILHGNWSSQVKISSGVYDPIYPSQILEYRLPNQ
jgi:uncharacterized protein (TIGR02594 family)